MQAVDKSSLPSIAFIGGGNMAQAIIAGLLKTGMAASELHVAEPNVELHPTLRGLGVQVYASATQALAHSEVCVLAVKPQVLPTVLTEHAQALNSQLIVSIAAGVPLKVMHSIVGEQSRIVRAMPNTPAMIGQGATGVYAPITLPQQDKDIAFAILSATGLVVWVHTEQDIDAVTAVSGSGPAYYFLMMESMIAAGIKAGLSPETAHALTVQTALGAATLAQNSALDPEQLRANVTSPNGTTQAAIEYMQLHNVDGAIAGGVLAAFNRSKELAKEAVAKIAP